MTRAKSYLHLTSGTPPKHLALLLIGVILFFAALTPFTIAVAAPPPDDPQLGEISLGAEDNGGQVQLREGQLLVLSLEGNPSTGYSWEVEEADEAVLRQKGTVEFEPDSSLHGSVPMLGTPGKQILRFEAIAAGQTSLRLAYRRPWEHSKEPARTFSILIKSVGPFTDANPRSTPTPEAEPSAESLGLDLARDPAAGAGQTRLGLPTAFNWCSQGKCTPVKDQGSCGSCWTFGTVGPLEINMLIRDSVTRDLAEQYLLSCNTEGWGCNGGWWAHDYHLNEVPPGEPEAGAVYEINFPYTARDDFCNPPHPHHEKVASWHYVGSPDGVPSPAAIKQAIFDYGPVAAAVCVGHAFQEYTGGVFQDNECSEVNHAIVLVGWDDSQGVWYLRNSWGTSWGEDGGYMRIKYGTSSVGYSANYVVYSGGSCQDAYEADDSFTSASLITVNGAVQAHNFHQDGDRDWAKLEVMAGDAYTITTSSLGTDSDTVLELFDMNGTTKLGDDECPGLASCINNWIAPSTGTYFMKVRDASGQGDCAGYEYDLRVVDNNFGKISELFLPLIAKSSAGGGLLNGDFESGPSIWDEYSTHGWELITRYFPGNVSPHGGSWAVWLGGDLDEISYVQQQATVTYNSPYLAYWHWIASEDICGYDFGGVIVNNSVVVDEYNLCSSTNTGGWVKRVVDLSSYRGQIVSLQIRSETDSSLNSNLFIDDVSFQTSAWSAKATPVFSGLSNAASKSQEVTPRNEDESRKTPTEPLLGREGVARATK